MKNTRILESIKTLKGYVSDLKEMLFRPKGQSFLFLSRSIQRYIEMIENRANICSRLAEHDYANHYVGIITREIGDIRRIVFDYSSHMSECMETEEDMSICFDLIELNISYLESLFVQPELEISDQEV